MPRFRGDCSSDYLADKPNKPCPLLKKKKKKKRSAFLLNGPWRGMAP